MAQLTQDCFAVGGALLSVDEATALIHARVAVVATSEIVPICGADGRIAAEDVAAAIALPPHDNSAVDGYAVRHADLGPGETVLPLGGRIAAGESGAGIETAGRAIRIFTGAPLPAGADTVFMQEDVRREGDRVALPPGLAAGANRRLAGEDVRPGDVVIAAGTRLGPAHVALAAALGCDGIAVRRRLRVALFSTGAELTDGPGPLQPGRIHDANRPLLAALLRRAGAEIVDHGVLPDDPQLIRARLVAAREMADLVVTSGGVSVGEEDHVTGAIAREGSLAFWRLAVKPGRPVAMGMIGGTPVVGLPGNPIAAYVTFLFVVAPLMARLGGAAWREPLSLRLPAAFAWRKKPGRREYLRVGLRPGADGETELVKFPRDGSALLSSLTGSDGLAEIPEDTTELTPGTRLRFFPHAVLQNP